MVRRSVEQVSLVECYDENNIKPIRSKYLFPIPEPAYNYTGWCEMECCNSTTQETCYEYEDDVLTNQYCRLVRQLCPHLRINYFPLTQIVLMEQSRSYSGFRIHSFPKEAALVQQVRRNVVQVSSLVFRLWVHETNKICSHSFSSHNQT